MALSNLKVEPRRELTESAIGIGAIALFLAGDYFLTNLEIKVSIRHGWGLGSNGVDLWMMMAVNVMAIILLVIVGVMLAMFTHFIGEQICAKLARLGKDPRPKERYIIRQVWNPETRDYENKRVKVG